MPIFSYTAVNPEGKTVRGTVEAPDTATAKDALKNLRYEVQALGEPSRSQKGAPIAAGNAPLSPKPSFVYEGTDTAGVLHKGTVQAGNRQEAFEQLKRNQGLTPSRLSLLGAPPLANDPELERWKKEMIPSVPPAKKTLSFSPATGEVQATTPPTPTPTALPRYHPLLATLRLYAGWLLAWYALFVAVGYYARERSLPWDIPFVGAFAASGLVFSFVVAIFFFLLLSSLHRAMHGKALLGAGLTFVWLAAIVGVRLLE